MPSLRVAAAGVIWAWLGVTGTVRAEGTELYLRPYLWLPSLDGEAAIGDIATDVNVSYSDVIDALDFGLMLQVEARRGQWGLLLDGMYVDLSEAQATPGQFFSLITTEIRLAVIDLGLAYRVVEGDQGWVDLLAGGRYLNTRVLMTRDPDFEAIDDISGQVVSQVTGEVRSHVENEVRRNSERIAEEVARIKDDVGEAAQERVKEEVRARIRDTLQGILEEIGGLLPPPGVDASFGDGNGTLGNRIGEGMSAGSDPAVQGIWDSIRDAIAERVQERIEERIEEIQGNADEIRKEIERAARERLNELKRNASSKVRKEIEKAEQQLAGVVEQGMQQAADEDLEETRDWVDPYVGARAQLNLSERFYLGARGDVGGFGIGSDFTWQAFGGVGVALSNTFTLEAGWRHLAIDYSHDSMELDIAFSGATLGLGIAF